MNNDGPPSPPNKVRKLSDLPKVSLYRLEAPKGLPMRLEEVVRRRAIGYCNCLADYHPLQVQETSSHFTQPQFLTSPSQATRHSPLDVSPQSSRPRSEATPSPHANIPQASGISPHFGRGSISDTLVSPQAYRGSFSQPMQSPQVSRSQPPEQPYIGPYNGIKSEVSSFDVLRPPALTILQPMPMQSLPVNAISPKIERRPSSKPKPRRQKFREKPIWAMKVSEWQKLRPDQRLQPAPEPKPETTPAPQPSLRPLQTTSDGWEPSITNILPSEELSRTVAGGRGGDRGER